MRKTKNAIASEREPPLRTSAGKDGCKVNQSNRLLRAFDSIESLKLISRFGRSWEHAGVLESEARVLRRRCVFKKMGRAGRAMHSGVEHSPPAALSENCTELQDQTTCEI
jgi:hypothetical protein